ncbi:MAG: ribonuclease HII [Nanoarchaeota archaeon]|nr:ribonuclease HII [Nanoarchaeota archaeon]
MLICGIDEARRGPVIGPMVLCGVLIEEKDTQKLKQMGVKDSKLLTPKKREFLEPRIKKVVHSYKAIIIPPQEIDEALESPELNLNKLEAIKTAMILNCLKPGKAIIDCPSTNIKAYLNYLRIYLKDKKLNLKAEHNAERYPVVAAASIIAKTTADRELKKIQSRIKENIGSGYPSDPITQEFLKNNHKKYLEIFRKTWASYKRVTSPKQSTLPEFKTIQK